MHRLARLPMTLSDLRRVIPAIAKVSESNIPRKYSIFSWDALADEH